MRRSASGGMGSVQCSQPRSENHALITGHIRTGACAWTRCSFGIMARRIIYGALSIMKVRCYRYCHKAARSQGSAEVSEAYDEAIWRAIFDRAGPASAISGSNESHRCIRSPGMRSMAQQPNRKFKPAVSLTRGRDDAVQRHQDPPEVCRCSRFDPQTRHSRPKNFLPRLFQAELLRRSDRVVGNRCMNLASPG